MSFLYSGYFAEIKIHTANTNTGATANIESVTTLSVLAGYTTVSMKCRVVYATPKIEIERFLGGYEQANLQIEFNPETMPIKYADETNFQSYFLTTFLAKPYKWIEIVGYKLMPSGLTAGKAIKVKYDGDYNVIENDDGTKQIGIKLYANI